ncbi:MAG: PH domain-containing protein [Eubacterium sp.]|nr:PH domain-containing protein [Eubacterium sp.]
MIKKNSDKLLWYDRKRTFLGLPWSFTKYALTKEKLVVDVGFLNLTEYEVRLYRVVNVNLKKSLGQRMFGLGTIHIDSNDHDLRSFDLKNIKNADEVKELLSDQVEAERQRNHVSSREVMMNDAGSYEDRETDMQDYGGHDDYEPDQDDNDEHDDSFDPDDNDWNGPEDEN